MRTRARYLDGDGATLPDGKTMQRELNADDWTVRGRNIKGGRRYRVCLHRRDESAVRGDRPCKQEPLTAFAFQVAKSFKLRTRFDALGDDLQIEVLCHRDNRTNELGIGSLVVDQVHERAIDL